MMPSAIMVHTHQWTGAGLSCPSLFCYEMEVIMATLAQLKRDANSGKMSVILMWRFGATGDNLPPNLRGMRKVLKANSVGLVVETNGKGSTLYIDSAKLVDYDGKFLTVYRAGYRVPTAEERFVLNTWNSMETEYFQKNPFGDCFGKRKAYFASSACPWMDGITKKCGKSYVSHKDKVLDQSVRGEMALCYQVFMED